MVGTGQAPLGARDRDRLTSPGRVDGSALGSYIVSLRWRGTAPSAPVCIKPYNRPAGEGDPPLVAGATTLPPLRGGTITRAYCRAIYEESVSRCFILPPEQGEVRRSRIGGGERSEPISRMIIVPYDTESKSRDAGFLGTSPCRA